MFALRITGGVFLIHAAFANEGALLQRIFPVIQADELHRFRHDLGHFVRGHPQGLAALFLLMLDFRKNLVIRVVHTVQVGAVVVVAGADTVAQPVFVGLIAGCVANLVGSTRPIYHRKPIRVFALSNILLNRLSAHVNTNRENGNAAALYCGSHFPGPDGRLVGVAGAIRTRFV